MEQAPESRPNGESQFSSRHDIELEIAKRLFRVGTRVERWNVNRTRNSAAGEDLELSLAQLACLYHIRQGIDTPGELAKMLLVTPTAITALVDRLVRRGYVNREHDTVDRRRVILTVTESGHRASEATVEVVAESLAEMFASLSEKEVEQISTGMLLLETALDHAQPLKEFRDSSRG
jgi:DNA-binding MarR family transcriptional regulator